MVLSSMKAGAEQTVDRRLQRIKEIIIQKGGYKLQGSFTLASGRVSNLYFNTKTATLDPEGVSLIAEVVYDRIKDLGVTSIGGLVQGSIPIAVVVAQLSYRRRPDRPIQAFWVRKEQKEHGDKTTFEGTLTPNSKVIVVDDVATTGGSIDNAIKGVVAQNCEIERIIVLLDREEGAKERFTKEGYDYECLLRASDFR